MRITLPLFAVIVIVIAIGLGINGCQNPMETEPAATDEPAPVDLAAVTQVYEGVIPPFICGSEVVSTMMTGRNHRSGAIKVANDNEFLYVAFEAEPDFDILNSHLAVVRSLRDVPQSPEGEPLPGKFVLKRLNNKGTISHTYKIPLAALLVDPSRDCGRTRLFILGHAVVQKKTEPGVEEPVWGSGKRFVLTGSWATYLFYQIQCCEAAPAPKEITCKPAWAYGNQTFVGAGISADPGWFESYAQGGTYTRDIIGGATGNDPATGTVVGVMTLDIVREATRATVTVTLDMNDGFVMNNVSTYWGITRPWTSDPTKWNFVVLPTGGAKTYTTSYGISGAIGDMPFYVSAAAEVCGPY